jgi:ferric enterobactin receptor
MILKIKNGLLLLIKFKRLRFIIIPFFLLLLKTGLGFSQEFHFINTPLSEAITQVADSFQVRVAFDAGLLSQVRINKILVGNTPEDLFKKLLEGSDYIYEMKYGRFLITKKVPHQEAMKKNIAVQGIISDKSTGERLPYASISVADENYQVITSVNGMFTLTIPDSGLYHLSARYLGFIPLDTTIQLPQDRTLNFTLDQKIHTLETVEISADKIEMVDFNGQAGYFSFNPIRFSDLPYIGETDVFRALQLLPGISYSESSSQLYIRGGDSDQNLVLFDGFTLYNLDHFFGIFSALNPFVIKNIAVYKGGFESRYGERVSGIIDITSKDGNKIKPAINGGIDLISANLSTEIPVSKKLTFIAAGRRAYSDLYSTFLADELIQSKFGQQIGTRGMPDNVIEPKFRFGDFNVKATYQPNDNENISLSVYGSGDFLDNSNTSGRDSFIIDTQDKNGWGNFGLGFSWKKQWNAKYFSNLQFGQSGYYNNYYNNTTVKTSSGEVVPIPSPGGDNHSLVSEKNQLTDIFLSWKNTILVNRNNIFDLGLSVKYNKFGYYKDAGNSLIYDDIGSTSMLYSLFFQDNHSSAKGFTFKPGLRVSLYGNTGKIYFEPRFSGSYQINKHLFFKTAIGRFYQFLSKSTTEQTYGYNRDFWVLADNSGHPVVYSNHFIAGAGVKTKYIDFDLETYYKTIGGLQEYLFFENGDPGFPGGGTTPPDGVHQPNDYRRFITGTGKAWGLDFLVKYENNHHSSIFSYSFTKAHLNFNEINYNSDLPVPYGHTHELKWTNLYIWHRWHFSTLIIYTTGKPYILSSDKTENFQVTRFYSKLPDYFRTDLSVNYNFNIKKVNIKPGISVINVFNTENYYDAFTRRIITNNSISNETTLIKSPGLTFNFFVNFRF